MARETAQELKLLAAFTEDLVVGTQYLHHGFTTLLQPDALFWSLVHKHSCRQKSQTQKIKMLVLFLKVHLHYSIKLNPCIIKHTNAGP